MFVRLFLFLIYLFSKYRYPNFDFVIFRSFEICKIWEKIIYKNCMEIIVYFNEKYIKRNIKKIFYFYYTNIINIYSMIERRITKNKMNFKNFSKIL